MNSFDSAFEKVCRLVDDFKENENHYLSPKYNEQQARKDYIDRLFIALGWDVNHTEQRNPYRQEVKVEETQINQRRPDYTFYIEPKFKEPKFFVEAKKPSRNLKDAMFYYQTIRYARFASTSVAVLTDFEEFHILDCRFKPDINTVLKNTNHKVFHYTDYADKEKFEKIYYLFSREEVSKNSLQDYSDSLPKLKIKGVQAAVLKLEQQSLDEEFLVYLDNVREKLAKAFKKNDLNLTSDELTEATQRTIDRLVFIRFLEDKLIEDDDYVSKLGLSKNSWADFISICKTLNSKYNGIVFKEHFIDSQRFSGPELSGFADICLDFSQRNPNGYNYNLIPIHILGSIYERFLGKVVIATDKRVRIDEKPEVRKAGGVYYTPKYIVDYIVDNTVGKILRNETGDCHSCESRNPVKGKTPKEITKLRFADIACGSGSFLIGVFETLLEYHNNYYWNHHDEAKADGCLFKDGAPVLNIRQKQNILLNNIYGVDIDHQAVEVTQLSLALKMLEDETLATANEMQVLFHEKILPDLTKNIVCGNSLIGTDILEGKMFPSEEERKLNPMDFEKRFPHIFCHSGESRKPENKGFDAIVGNPPWGVDFTEIELSYLRKCYVDIIVRMIDSFMYFVYKSITILKKSGFYGMILPDVILYQKDNIKLREYIIKNTKLVSVVNLGNGVFINVNRPSCIIILKNALLSNDSTIIKDLSNYKEKGSLLFDGKYQIIDQRRYLEINDLCFVTSGLSKYELLNKIYKIPHYQLGELVDDDGIQRGVSPDLKEAFIVDDNKVLQYHLESGFVRKTVTGGRQIKRYHIIDHGHKLIYTNRETEFSRIPNICKYIDQFKNKITCVEVKQKKHSIYSLHRAREEKIFNKKEKIIGVITEDEIIVTIDSDGYYPTDGAYLFASRNINSKYLISILNSKLFVFIYRLLSMESGRTLAQVKPTTLSKLPIIISDNPTTKTILVNLADQMLDSKKQLYNAKTEKDKTYYETKCADLDNAIDAEVYKLYGLTEEEIKIVEGKI